MMILKDENGKEFYPASSTMTLCTRSPCPNNRENPVFDTVQLADYETPNGFRLLLLFFIFILFLNVCIFS